MFTTKSKTKTHLEDGTYSGKMNGYIAEVRIKASTISDSLSIAKTHTIDVEIECVNGLRGFNIPVTVTVKDGYATITN